MGQNLSDLAGEYSSNIFWTNHEISAVDPLF